MKDNIKQILHTTAEIKDQASMLEIHAREIENAINEPEGDIILFKTNPNHDLKEEYDQCDNRLQFVYNSLSAALYRKFKYKTTITMINRFDSEQDRIYLNVQKFVNGIWIPDTEKIERYKANPWKSPHQTEEDERCRALDFRTKDMPEKVLDYTDRYLGDKQVVYTGPKNTLLRHAVYKDGKHGHMQVDKDNFTSIKRYEI